MSHRVFISYRRSKTEPVDALVEALEAEGVEAWIDRREIEDAASIQARIDEGLAHSHALLAWYSADYPKSRACQWELTAALIAAQAETAPVKRILVVNPEHDAAHIQPLQVSDLQHYTVRDDLFQMAHAIAADVAQIEGELGALRRLDKPSYYGFTPLGSNRFVGRIDELWKIHSTLSASRFAIVSGRPTPTAAGDTVQVRGSGGIGKSLLAEEYALRFGNCWPGGIFWLRAYGNSDNSEETEEQLAERRRVAYDSQWLEFATRLGLETYEQTTAELRAAVARQLIEPYLWIVDDLPACGREELEHWLAPNGYGQTLVTTRSRRLDGVGENIDLGVLVPEVAYSLLTREHVPSAEEEDAVSRILTLLDGHALALDIARAACRRLGYANFLQRLESPDKDAMTLAAKLAPELPNGHNPHIATTFLSSVQQLDKHGRDCMALAAHLAAAPIPIQLLADCLALADGLDEATAMEVAAIGVQQLLDHSLADDGHDAKVFSVHSLLRLTAHQFEMATQARVEDLRQAVIAALNERMQLAADIRKHALLAPLLLHATLPAKNVADAGSAALAGWLGRFEYEAGRFWEAKRWFMAQCDWCAGNLGEEHPDTLTSMNNLAGTLEAQGDHTSARSLQEQVLDIRRRILGEEHPATLTSMNNLADTLRAQGDHTSARSLQEQVLGISRRVLGEEHPATLTSMNNLAGTLGAQGDNAGAQALQEQVLEMRRRVLGEKHPDTLTSMNNLASTLKVQGDHTSAGALQEQVLGISRRVLGEEHPATLTSMNNLASTLGAQGDHTSAQSLKEQVLDIRRHVLGEEHPATLNSMNNLADTLRAQGDHTSAQSLQEQVLGISRRVLGEEHPATLNSMNNLAGTLGAQGDNAGAQALQEQVLEMRRRVLGDEHPDTLASMNNLAGILWAQGERAGARSLQEQVLERRRRVLGATHPSTSISAWNLLCTLYKLSEHHAARTVANECLRWLIDQDPANLGADEKRVRELFIEWQKKNQ